MNSNLLYSFNWKFIGKHCRHETVLFWKGIEVHVKIDSENTLMVRCIDYTIDINEKHYKYTILYSHGKAFRGKIDDIPYDGWKLVFKPQQNSFAIYEEQIVSEEGTFQEDFDICQPGFVDNPDHNLCPIESLTNPLIIDQDSSWLVITDDFTVHEYKVGFPVKNIILWIKKSFNRQYDANVQLFTYEFYSQSFHMFPWEVGNFICTRVFDVCKNTGCGNYLTTHCEISDKNMIIRTFDCGEQGKDAVSLLIRFMLKISDYADWEVFDSNRKLNKENDITDETLSIMRIVD